MTKMAKIASSQKQKKYLILLNDLSYSMSDYLGSNRLTQINTQKQKMLSTISI